jgi:hypothetical protein
MNRLHWPWSTAPLATPFLCHRSIDTLNDRSWHTEACAFVHRPMQSKI